MKQIKTAVFGSGFMGRVHLEALRRVEFVDLAGYDGAIAGYRQTTLDTFQQVEDNLVVLRVLATESQQQHVATEAAEQTCSSS